MRAARISAQHKQLLRHHSITLSARGARYKVVCVRSQSPPPATTVQCLVCRHPFAAANGEDILKYFLVSRPRRREEAGCVSTAESPALGEAGLGAELKWPGTQPHLILMQPDDVLMNRPSRSATRQVVNVFTGTVDHKGLR